VTELQLANVIISISNTVIIRYGGFTAHQIQLQNMLPTLHAY